MDWRYKLHYQYSLWGVTEKLIAVNVLVFVLMIILRLFGFLFKVEGITYYVYLWLGFPDYLSGFLLRPWTIITYAFVHTGLWHIAGNMIVLYFSGRFFLTFFSAKRLLNYYFLGAIAGGLFFMASYSLFPAFAHSGRIPLVGASAAIMAILIGVAAQAPNYKIRLMIFGNIKLWWIAAFFVAIDLISIPAGNAGGHIAHLGGALLGFVYTKQLAEGRDIGAWWGRFMDWVVSLFSAHPKRTFKKVYKNKKKPAGQRGPYQSNRQNQAEKQKKIDAILDKISKNGYDSLSKEEKGFLFNSGKD